jgi:hypothetical protein
MSVSTRFALVVVLSSLMSATWVMPAHAGPVQVILVGANEVPGPGDPDGDGTFVAKINAGRATLCYTLTVSGIEPATAAHVHVGTIAEAGPVVIALVPPTTGSSTACASADRELLRAITRNPDNYYVNVHNAAYPAGALRGQFS